MKEQSQAEWLIQVFESFKKSSHRDSDGTPIHLAVVAELRRLLAERDALRAERDQAQMVCAEAYQVVGSMLDDLGQFNTVRAGKVLDNLAEHRMLHDDVLPWPSFEIAARSKGEGGT